MTHAEPDLTLFVSDAARMGEILEAVFDAEEADSIFVVGDLRIAVRQDDHVDQRVYNHIALEVHEADIDRYLDRIRALQLDVMPPLVRKEGKGRSLFFHDADHHLFALHGSLREPMHLGPAVSIASQGAHP